MKGSHVNGILVHNDRIYIISNDYTVSVHDLEGRSITSWSQTHASGKPIITNNQLLTFDTLNKAQVFCSLNGEVVRRTPLRIGPTYTPKHMSAADKNSIIISDSGASLVYKEDTVSGDIIWQCTDVAGPCGVTCYREEFVLVADSNSLCVLSLHTG